MVNLQKCTGEKGIVGLTFLPVIPETFSLILMFYSFVRDLMSKELKANTIIQIHVLPEGDHVDVIDANPDPINININVVNTDAEDLLTSELFAAASTTTTTTTANPEYTNCSAILLPGETFEDYQRNVALASLTFIWLFLFWWLNSLTFCIACCFRKRSNGYTKWTSIIYAVAWLTAGLLILATFLLQMDDDRVKHHNICYVKSDTPVQFRKCRSLICQAAVARLVAFGLAILSCWLHILCFVAAVGQSRDEQEEAQLEQLKKDHEDEHEEELPFIGSSSIKKTFSSHSTGTDESTIEKPPSPKKSRSCHCSKVNTGQLVPPKPRPKARSSDRMDCEEARRRMKRKLMEATPDESLASIIKESIASVAYSSSSLASQILDEDSETVKGIVKGAIEDIDEIRYLNSEICTPASRASQANVDVHVDISNLNLDADVLNFYEYEDERPRTRHRVRVKIPEPD